MNQTQFASLASGCSQCDAILARLRERAGAWVQMPELCRVSGAYAVHSRISDLRARGHEIEQRSKRAGRTVQSAYRLVVCAAVPEPEPDAHNAALC